MDLPLDQLAAEPAEGALPGRGDDRRGGQHRGHGPAARHRAMDAVRRDPGAVHAGLGTCAPIPGERPPAGGGEPPAAGGAGPPGAAAAGKDQLAFVDIDSMQKRVYGHHKQGARP